ncbi:hypothetical protein Glove_709g78 [Diversispora epigaea]|uniref:Rieske domain-containing protein n=1 Tax=Diversispora epigaea TaxID=1348612 RepID=A0A397G437_9GLOM|nr:hypothetical protein Glove_709g78 [Diversispora epigaea]
MLHRQKKTPTSTKSSELLFASYLANMNATKGSLKQSKSRENIRVDHTRIDTLVKQVGMENSWNENQLKLILTVLIKNRIYTVNDLRSLSKESWARIELLSSIKDLLYATINRRYDENFVVKTKTEKKRNESNDREVLGSKEIKENISNNIVNPLPSPLLENNNKPSLFLPPPNKKVDGNRLKVKTADGKIYQVDRWCPHDNADLNTKGIIIGSKLFCTKHNWSFDLENGGIYTNGSENSSINASLINVW